MEFGLNSDTHIYRIGLEVHGVGPRFRGEKLLLGIDSKSALVLIQNVPLC